jgi:hypothetical protein
VYIFDAGRWDFCFLIDTQGCGDYIVRKGIAEKGGAA